MDQSVFIWPVHLIRPIFFHDSENNRFFFSATEGTNGYELWKSDGTADGTVMVADINSGSGSSNPRRFVKVGENILFFAAESGSNHELWKTNGDVSGTSLVKDINPGATASFDRTGSVESLAGRALVLNNVLLFAANDGTHGIELWKSDGTTEGTVLVKDINAGASNSSPENFVILNSEIYFTATDGINGVELWKTDGTTEGTQLVKDIRPGSSGSSISGLPVLDSYIYFTADNGTDGRELWKSDGTAEGTVMVADINAGALHSDPYGVTLLGQDIFFTATTVAAGRELYRYNVSNDSITLFDINSGSNSGLESGAPIIAYNNNLFMRAYSPVAGVNFPIWKYEPITTPIFIASTTASVVTQTEATIVAEFEDIGSFPVTERGFEYGTTGSFGSTVEDSGSFTRSEVYSDTITGLTCNTEYHVRPYAISVGDTGYGTTITFTTSECPAAEPESEEAPRRRGGGGRTRIQTPVTALTQIPVAPVTSIVTPPSGQIGSVGPNTPFNSTIPASTIPVAGNSANFSRNLTTGSRGDDVAGLQKILIQKGYLALGYDTGYFGNLTQAALIKYQADNNINPAVGYFGPVTRAALGNLVEQVSTVAPATPVIPTTFNRDLTIGSTGNDVTALQNILIQKGYLEAGYATGYFGNLTQAALAKYQVENGITPATGYFGPITKAKILEAN